MLLNLTGTIDSHNIWWVAVNIHKYTMSSFNDYVRV